ncbi:MAG: glycosyltransferase family 4 protein [Verrucomicrobiaceae bacterium]|nr:glycosyltransferase family 4 protein [Verrucomicrobiaceae bacterium]
MRIAYFLTHPIQYQSPLIRHLRAGGVDVHVVYGHDATARAYFDKGFGQRLAWDVPLLDGYPSTVLNTEEPKGGLKKQRAHFERQIMTLLEKEKFDAAWVHGWAHPFTQAAWRQARGRKMPILLRGETFLGCVRGGKLRRLAHKLIFTRKFREVSAFLAVGKLNAELYRAYGVESRRIFQAPYVVDNAFFQKRCQEATPHREKLRAELGIEPGRPVILFCAKLISVKSPDVLIRAVGGLAGAPARGRDEDSQTGAHPRSPRQTRVLADAPTAPVLLMVGDGELRPSLEKLASEVAPGRVKFLGFRNQSELPGLYDLCDMFVLPSAFEPWGLVVNEVMNAGKTVVVSDQVGSGPDLVREGVNGSIFHAGDVMALSQVLDRWCGDASARERAGGTSLEIISKWGFDEVLAGLKEALVHLS